MILLEIHSTELLGFAKELYTGWKESKMIPRVLAWAIRMTRASQDHPSHASIHICLGGKKKQELFLVWQAAVLIFHPEKSFLEEEVLPISGSLYQNEKAH